MKSTKQSQPKVRIPAAYRKHARLVAIPESAYQTLRDKASTRVFKVRPLDQVTSELAAAYPEDPALVADVIEGLKKSSLYAKRSAAAR